MKKLFLLALSLCLGLLCIAATLKHNSGGATYQRGKINSLSFQIEYPNGQTKQVSLTSEQMKELGGIYFNDALIKSDEITQWNVSATDWKLNPTMMLINVGIDNSLRSTPYCRWKWHVVNGDY